MVQQNTEGRKSTQRVQVNRQAFSELSRPMRDCGFAVTGHTLPRRDASPARTRLDAFPKSQPSWRTRGLSFNAHAAAPYGRDGERHTDHDESLIRWLLQNTETQCGKQRGHEQQSEWLLALSTFHCGES